MGGEDPGSPDPDVFWISGRNWQNEKEGTTGSGFFQDT